MASRGVGMKVFNELVFDQKVSGNQRLVSSAVWNETLGKEVEIVESTAASFTVEYLHTIPIPVDVEGPGDPGEDERWSASTALYPPTPGYGLGGLRLRMFQEEGDDTTALLCGFETDCG